MKFLIVDDDTIARQMLRKILCDYGHFDYAATGAEAIDCFVQALDENLPYDMVFLDIIMPGMNGHEVLKQIRIIEAERDLKGLDGVKVVMITVLEDSKNILGAFNEGCEGYIVKPFEKAQIHKKITEAVR